MSSTTSKEDRKKALALAIFQAIQKSSYLRGILVTAISDAQKAFFISELLVTFPDAFAGRSEPPLQLFDIITIWFGKYNDGLMFRDVEDALKQRKTYFTIQRHRKTDFIRGIGLDWSPRTRDAFLGAIRTISLAKLDTPFPIVKHWICETDAVDHKWQDYLHNDPRAQPDRRRPRLPIFRLDPAQLQLDINADENALVYDQSTGELLLVVIRNFCQNPDLLAHIDRIIKQSVECRKSMRVCNSIHLLTH
jgi:hypothetical protein